jgi:hypothetical protein
MHPLDNRVCRPLHTYDWGHSLKVEAIHLLLYSIIDTPYIIRRFTYNACRIIGVSNPSGGKRFSSSHLSRPALGPIYRPVKYVPGIIPWPGRDVDHPPSASSAEVKIG